GLGVYDYATARAFYANTVDVRDDNVTVGTRGGEGLAQANIVDTSYFYPAHWVNDAQYNTIHYSQWNNPFHLLRNCKAADTSPPAGWDETKNGKYDPVFDGHIVRAEKCERMPVAFVDWRDMVPDQASNYYLYDPRLVVTRRAVDEQGRP